MHLTHARQAHFRDEQRHDPQMRELRTEFARFCIDRLKTVRKDSDRYLAAAAGKAAPLSACRKGAPSDLGAGHHRGYLPDKCGLRGTF